MWIFEVLVVNGGTSGDSRLDSGPAVLSYEAWILKYQDTMLSRLSRLSTAAKGSKPSTHPEPSKHPEPRLSGSLGSAQGLLLYTLAPTTPFDHPEDRIHNPLLPAAVANAPANAAAGIQSAMILLEKIFSSLLDDDALRVYVVPPYTEYPEEPIILGPFEIAIICGADQAPTGRRVVHEGWWPLENLVADDLEQLTTLYQRLAGSLTLGSRNSAARNNRAKSVQDRGMSRVACPRYS